MIVKLLTEYHLMFLSFKGDCTGSSESTLVKMPIIVGNLMPRLNCKNNDITSLNAGLFFKIYLSSSWFSLFASF